MPLTISEMVTHDSSLTIHIRARRGITHLLGPYLKIGCRRKRPESGVRRLLAVAAALGQRALSCRPLGVVNLRLFPPRNEPIIFNPLLPT